MNIEYVILIGLALTFYFTNIKEYFEDNKNKNFIKDNLDLGCLIETHSGIIGEVIEIDDVSILILTGDRDRSSYIKINKDNVKSIISEKA